MGNHQSLIYITHYASLSLRQVRASPVSGLRDECTCQWKLFEHQANRCLLKTSPQLLIAQTRQEASSHAKATAERLLPHWPFKMSPFCLVYRLSYLLVCFCAAAVAHLRPSSPRRTSRRAPTSMSFWNTQRQHSAVATWGRLSCCQKERISMSGLPSTVSWWTQQNSL